MRDLTATALHTLVAEAEAVIHRAIRFSKRGTAPAMQRHECWQGSTVLEGALSDLRQLHRPGPHPRRKIRAAMRAAAAAVRTVRVFDFAPDDVVDLDWYPAVVASYPQRATRILLWVHWNENVVVPTTAQILAARRAEAAGQVGFECTAASMYRTRQYALQTRDPVLRGVAIDGCPDMARLWAEAHGRIDPVIVGDPCPTRQILTVKAHIVGTEHMVSATAGGVL